MIAAGIDSGSRALKVVILDTRSRESLGAVCVDQLLRDDTYPLEHLEALLADTGHAMSELAATVATGYGRNRTRGANATVTEITCHARGVHHLVPHTASVLEIGGQDSKVIRLRDGGRVSDFAMNDRCAAGTGRFLELASGLLGMTLDEFSAAAQEPGIRPTNISSTCAVFAESEILGLLAEGYAAAEIAAGVVESVAQRVVALAAGMLAEPVVFTGGVARMPAVAAALGRRMGGQLLVAPGPQFTGALGAALMAADRIAGNQ